MGRLRRMGWKRVMLWTGLVVLGIFALIQAVPYGRSHTNPPVTAEAPWDSARTRELAVRACYDCHSNETTWPWYSNVAPMSWLVQRDVDEGRGVLNFSEWDQPQAEAEVVQSVVTRPGRRLGDGHEERKVH